MSRSECGTVIFGAKRENFAILAADRLYHRPGTNEPTSEDQKIVAHEKLPIAVAVAGFKRLPINVGSLVRDHVKSALNSIDAGDEFTLRSVKNLLTLKISELVKEANAIEIQKYRDDEIGRRTAKCTFFIALMENGKARLGSISMDHTTEESEFPLSILGPNAISELQKRHSHDETRYLGLDLEDAPSLAARMIAVIEDAIQIDHAIADRKKQTRTIGGPIDCFIVSNDGAVRHDFVQ